MKNIAAKFGLAAEASEEAILAEVTKIMNRTTEAEAALTPLRDQVAKLTQETETLRGAQIESDLETYRNRFAPEQRESFKKLLIANREPTLKILQGLPEQGRTASRLVCNREASKTPADQAASKDAQRSAAVEDYRLRNRCSFQDAWNAVQREKPELFKTEPVGRGSCRAGPEPFQPTKTKGRKL
jgi:hypothetical protein